MGRLIISAALVLLAALSCSKTEQRNYYSDPDAVHFRAGVSSDTKTSPIGTEAEQTQFNIGDKIAISDGGAFFTYVLGTEGWAPENPAKFIRWTSASTTFKAYYPVRDGVSFSSASLPADQSTYNAIASADWMTATSTLSKPQSGFNVELQFQRKTARVKVTIDRYLDEFDGKNPTIESLSVCGTKTIAVNAAEAMSYYALLLPRSADAGSEFLTLTVSFTGGTKELVVRGIPDLEEGKTYSYSLTVGKNTVKVASIMVSDWGSGSESNGEAIN